ncbi:PLAT/LH2 domain-containing protein [Streptomyces syringium]|uniref:PLAT/LH2 domain-containing protein n=1 Tax=Streptomyces syringium TaxID=76729 RepID=UPI0036852544
MFRRTLACLASATVLALTAGAPAAHAETVEYTVTIRTADVYLGGTDSTVKGKLFNKQNGKWTYFDNSGNDFERNDTGTYTITVPSTFGTPTHFQLWKAGTDDWAVATPVIIKGPDNYSKAAYMEGNYTWFTGEDKHNRCQVDQANHVMRCNHYSPEMKLLNYE